MYTAATCFAVTALGTSWRAFARQLALAAGASALALLTLSIGTRVAYGAWPAWGGYLEYLRLYSTMEFGTLRIDFWSPALLMAAAVFLSAVGTPPSTGCRTGQSF